MPNDNYYSTLQSRTISWLRFPLIVLILFIHNPGLPKLTPWVDGGALWLNIFNVVRHIVTPSIAWVGVPVFYFISGFLFFININRFDQPTYKRKMHSRIQSLLIPYLAWNIVSALLLFLANSANGKSFPLFNPLYLWGYTETHWTNIFGYTHYLWYPADYPLWFLRDLIVVSLLSPAIYWLIKKTGVLFPALAWLVFASDLTEGLPGLSTRAIAFFSLGAYMGIKKMNIILTFRKVETASYVLAFILITLDTVQTTLGTRFYVHSPSLLITLIALFNLASRIVERGSLPISQRLAASTFFIYAMHTIYVMRYVEKIRDVLIPSVLPETVLPFFWILIPILKIAVCFVVYYMLERYFPKIAAVFTGARGRQEVKAKEHLA